MNARREYGLRLLILAFFFGFILLRQGKGFRRIIGCVHRATGVSLLS